MPPDDSVITGPITVEDEVEIRRPVGEVFDFLGDQEHRPAWNAGVKRVRRTSPGPIGVGTTYRIVGMMLGRRVVSTYELTAYQPDTLFSGRMRSPVFSVDETYRFEAAGEDGTCVRVEIAARPERWLRPLGPLLAVAMSRQVKADHRRLGTVLQRSRRARARAARAQQHEGAEAHHEGDGGEGDPRQ
ncbi:MAG: SRPBCC family protein [Actinomycetota bacterium]|nr:SRPBCC family protein [Actinomycetota bacterium]